MLEALACTVLFSLSMVLAHRTAKLVGSVRANLGRLLTATLLLGVWSHAFVRCLEGPGLLWFALSGCATFGIGDAAMFLALPRLGPRVVSLIALCLAPPVAALAERLWLGTRLPPAQVAWSAVILAGVALALFPRRGTKLEKSQLPLGILLALITTLGDAMGAVLSRKGFAVAKLAGLELSGSNAAYQRLVGGLALALVTALVFSRRTPAVAGGPPPTPLPKALPWIVAQACIGPVIGVSLLQRALSTTPSGIVLPIIAVTPIVVIPLAWILEGDRPDARSIVGGLIAVSAAVALTQAG